jgi:putative flippase GtrA
MNKYNIIQFLKFTVVGVLNTLIDWVIFFALTHYIPFFQITNHEVIAKSISFTVAVVNSFIWNSLWTFRNEYKTGLESGDKNAVATIYFGRFIVVSLIGLGLNTIVFYIMRPVGSAIFARVSLAQLFALAIATLAVLLWNFLANKFWTYKIEKSTAKSVQKNWLIYLAVGFMLLIMFLLSFLTMKKDSAIVDEVAHISAGYSYLEKQDMRMNPEHPPLAKIIAAVPLTFLHLNKPFNNWSWNGVNEWDLGWKFLYNSGNSADQILAWARTPMILLTLLIGLLLFKWANKLYGARTGLFVLFLFVFFPNFIAHDHFVTTDMAATLGFLVSIYFYDKQLKNPSVQNIFWAGVFFGLAQLLKFSTFLLIGMLPLYLIIRLLIFRKEIDFWKFLKNQIWGLVQIFLIGFGIVYLFYMVLYWNTPLAIENKLIDLSLPTAGASVYNHILKIMTGIPILAPIGHYLLGLIMVFSRVGGTQTSFLLGKYSASGFRMFFVYTFLFKVPLPIIILLISGIIWLFVRKIKKKARLGSDDNQRREDVWNIWVFLTFPTLYFLLAFRSDLDLGVRYLFPMFPFLFLFIGRFVQPVLIKKKIIQGIFLIILSVWYFLGTILIYPHFMAYFNELRYPLKLQKNQIFIDSSLDWGQDLRRLADYCQSNNIKNIKVDYFGGGLLSYYMPGATDWHSKDGQVKSGWLAVSVTYYQMSKFFGPRDHQMDYSYLDNIKPTAVIGDSILVYHFK